MQGVQKDYQEVSLALEGERYRAERLEEQINDLTELHQVSVMMECRGGQRGGGGRGGGCSLFSLSLTMRHYFLHPFSD